MVTPRWSATFRSSLKTDSRRDSMNFFPVATGSPVTGRFSVSSMLRLVIGAGRWVCIQICLVSRLDSDISGITGQHLERRGNLTVAEERAIYTRQRTSKSVLGCLKAAFLHGWRDRLLQEIMEKPSKPVPFETPRRPVSDEYHGVRVVDDYRWLEDLSNPEVKDWNVNQNAHTRSVLDGIPVREPVRERVASLYKASSADYLDIKYRGGRFFALKFQPPKQQRFLVTLSAVDDTSTER